MYSSEKLNDMTKDELKKIAESLAIPKISGMKKLDIINAIIEKETSDTKKKRERPSDVKEMTGVLEVKGDGYGFLRFENFAATADDIYVSPTQIRRFTLKTGDEITGDCRITDEEGKSSPLLFVKKINSDPLEKALKRRPFEKRVPVFPDEKINLETDSKEYATRLIDIIAPIGKGQRGMIVAPPKAGKTTIIKSLAKAIRIQSLLFCLLMKDLRRLRILKSRLTATLYIPLLTNSPKTTVVLQN